MNQLLEQISKFGVARLAAIAGLTAGAAAALVWFTTSMNGSGEALLFSGMEGEDAQVVTERLNEAGIAYDLREGGSAVYVDRNQVDEARMRVAQQGALGFGSVGYEIFDEADALGSTSFVQNMNAKRALEGELARSVNTLNAVRSARVHLSLPERELFNRDRQQASGSVVLTLNGDISEGQVATIRNLVSTAVPGLDANRITIADDRGRLLAGPSDGDAMSAIALESRREGVEENLQRKIQDVVEGVVGSGAARVVVTADLSRESLVENAEIFDPNGQVRVSRETSEEFSREPVGQDGVTVTENLPEADDPPAPGVGGGQPAEQRMAETGRESAIENFQNSSTRTTRTVEAGALQRLGISVVVDEIATLGDDGWEYQPRTEEQIAQIRELVLAAAGVDEQRGDRVEVAQMRFSRPELTDGTPAPSGFSLSRGDIMRIAEIAVLFITALLIVLLVARPLVRGVISGPQPALAGDGPALLPTDKKAPALAGSGEPPAQLPSRPAEDEDEHIDIAHIDGQVKKSSVKKVSQLVEKHPEETMSILRNWMHGEQT